MSKSQVDQIDQIDRDIISHLSRDARISNRAVAEKLGVTEGTIRARVKRLREAGLVRFTALTNMSRQGTLHLVFVRVKVDLKNVRRVAETIARMEEIKCVIVTTGVYNILAIGPIGDFDTGIDMISSRISALDGVHSLETSITLRGVKYNVQTAKILGGHDSEENGFEEESA